MKQLAGFVLVFLAPILIWAQGKFNIDNYRMLEDSILKFMDSNRIPGARFCITDQNTTLWIGNLGLADVS